MRAQRERDTGIERAIRSLLHARGLRFRVHRRLLKGSRREVDVVFRGAKVAVFVDGCFWHGCPEHSTVPRSNRTYWEPKLARNVARDREVDAALRTAGWLPLHMWEHEPLEAVVPRIESALAHRRPPVRVPRSAADERS